MKLYLMNIFSVLEKTILNRGVRRMNVKLVLKVLMSTLIVCIAVSLNGNIVIAKEKQQTLPENIIPITKENTHPTVAEDYEVVEPSKLTKELMETVKIPIKNPDLIKLLNETSVKPSLIGIGYRGMIYLGRWPLQYESEEIVVNWDFQQVNTNEINNTVGNETQELHYIQQTEKTVQGALSTKIDNPEVIKKMILQNTKETTNLPISFTTTVGKNTKLENFYHVPGEKQGTLRAYIPAIHDKGQVTFGEVYLQLKGTSKTIVVKNVTKQGVGAWMPIQDYIALSFQLK